MTKHYELGKKGEQIAVDFLSEQGYRILERNWRFLKAEVDIIAQKDNIIAAVEVKTRSSTAFGNPQDFIDTKKIKLLIMAMNEYIIQKDLEAEVRFDIIAVTKNKRDLDIEHIQDAFLHF